MWNVAAFSGEAWIELSVTSLDNQAYSSESLLQAVRARPELTDSRLSDYLAQEVEHPGARQEAIELWSKRAATESLEFDWASS